MYSQQEGSLSPWENQEYNISQREKCFSHQGAKKRPCWQTFQMKTFPDKFEAVLLLEHTHTHTHRLRMKPLDKSLEFSSHDYYKHSHWATWHTNLPGPLSYPGFSSNAWPPPLPCHWNIKRRIFHPNTILYTTTPLNVYLVCLDKRDVCRSLNTLTFLKLASNKKKQNNITK